VKILVKSNFENDLTSDREKNLSVEIIPPEKIKKLQMNIVSSHEIIKVEDGRNIN